MTKEDVLDSIRNLLESSEVADDGPLRDWEKHRAYYALTGRKMQGATNQVITYALLNEVTDNPRLFHECDKELTLRELKLIEVGLLQAAGDAEIVE